MIQRLIGKKRALIDIDTQKDLLLADGAECIGNHRRVLERIRRMIAWARHNNITIISTCEAYSGNGDGMHRCIYCTDGQRKISYTILNSRTSFPVSDSTDLPVDLLQRYRQVILQKRCIDPFEEPLIDRLLSEMHADEFILIGATAEGSVKATALGLLHRRKNVTIVRDAVGEHNKEERNRALRNVWAKGAKLVVTDKIAGTSHLRNVGICGCEMCKKHGNMDLPVVIEPARKPAKVAVAV